jgi:hypothetical protein
MDSVKQHPRLFLSLFGVPLLFHLLLWQMSILQLASKHYETWLPYLPVRACLAVQGLVWGGVGGIISILVALILFRVLAKPAQLHKHPVFYAISWLLPFCLFGLFGCAMCAAAPGAIPPSTPSQSLVAGLWGLAITGSFGGAGGVVAFTFLSRLLDQS